MIHDLPSENGDVEPALSVESHEGLTPLFREKKTKKWSKWSRRLPSTSHMWSSGGLQTSATLAAGAFVDLPLSALLPVEEEELVRGLGREGR